MAELGRFEGPEASTIGPLAVGARRPERLLYSVVSDR
jgi:hypothetical protein